MKKITLILLTVISFSTVDSVFAQNRDSLSFAQNDVRKNYGIYHLAKRYNDPVVARMALYQILVFTSNESAVLDSLALEYYSQQNYISAALVAKDNISVHPKSEISLEVGAASLSNIGVKDKALEYYEKLALINNQTDIYYQIAFLQYELKRYKEAQTTIDILNLRKEIDELKMIFPKKDKTNQEVSMRAALWNLKGLMAQEQGKNDEAKGFYLEAIKAAPGFEVAQSNLSKVGKE